MRRRDAVHAGMHTLNQADINATWRTPYDDLSNFITDALGKLNEADFELAADPELVKDWGVTKKRLDNAMRFCRNARDDIEKARQVWLETEIEVKS